MNPKKPHDSLKKTAADLQIDEIFVSALITAFYKTVRRELIEINKTRLEIHGLGCFDLKYFKVKYKLRDTIAFIQYHQKSNNTRSYAILQNLNRKLDTLEKANKLADKRAHDINETRKKRKEYILQNKTSLGE